VRKKILKIDSHQHVFCQFNAFVRCAECNGLIRDWRFKSGLLARVMLWLLALSLTHSLFSAACCVTVPGCYCILSLSSFAGTNSSKFVCTCAHSLYFHCITISLFWVSLSLFLFSFSSQNIVFQTLFSLSYHLSKQRFCKHLRLRFSVCWSVSSLIVVFPFWVFSIL